MTRTKGTKIITWIFAAAILLGMAFPAQVHAENTEDNTERLVRVGYAGSENFTGGAGPDLRKSGYAYEYLQLVAANTGWKYEYVYGDWSDLFEMLKNGEIDVMPGISYSEERAESIAYPNHEMGVENYFVFAKRDSDYATSQTKDIAGATVGVIKESLLEASMLEWNEANGNACKIEEFSGFESMYEAVNNGEVDLIVDTDNGVMTEYGLEPIVRIGYSNYYLAVSKSAIDILDELNRYLDEVITDNPYLINNLQYKYYSDTEVNLSLDIDELDYLRENPVIRIAYEKDFLAFCGYDIETGECIGALRSFVDNIYEKYDKKIFTIELIPYDDVEESLAALKAGDVDAAFTLYQSYYEAEKEDLVLSDSIAMTGMTAIVNENKKFKEYEENTVAVTKGFTDIVWFVRETYPNWKIVEYDSFDECIDAVKRGDADCVVESTYVYKNLVDYRTIKMVSLSSTADLCFAVNQKDYELGKIINHLIKVNSKSEFQAALSIYSSKESEYDLEDIIKENILVIGAIVFITLLILILLLFGLLYEQQKTEKARKEAADLNRNLQAKQMELENALEGAETSSRSKTVFLSNMSHDIRTPMNAIIGFADLLEINKDNPEIVSDYVKKIQSSGEYLLALINNVLDMARIESGKIILEENDINIEADAEKLGDIFAEEIKAKNLKFSNKVEVQHPYIRGDSTKIKQLGMNLVSNAIKYTPEGGSIEVSTREIASNRIGYARYITMVTDTGVGMSQDFVNHIFESFSRERNTTQSRVMGTGLGMAIVKSIVDMMDGKISVKSTPGKGTCITVILDYKIIDNPSETEERPKKELLDLDKLKDKRVLIAEDNDLNYEIASNILGNAGIKTDRAKDGDECVSIIRAHAPGYYFAILMDIQMPRLDGYGATMEIREMTDGRGDIPIIAMTANAFDEDKGRALAAGMDGHIVKPIKLATIIEELSKYII